MKKKTQAPHEEIKGYLKAAKERLASAFFVRPEWRKPKSIAGVNLIISRINEVYYPFSDRKSPKLAVWKQVLKEKREEMIEEIEAAKETQEKENKIKASGVVKEPVRLIEPGFKGTPAAPSPANAWTKESVAKLLANITSCRAGAKIARALEISQPYLSYILRVGWSGKKGAEYLPKIEAEMLRISVFGDDKSGAVVRDSKGRAITARLDPDKLRKIFVNTDKTINAVPPQLDRSLIDFPIRGNSLISYMDVEIKDGKLHVHVVVDADAAFGMYRERQLSISKDEIKFTLA